MAVAFAAVGEASTAAAAAAAVGAAAAAAVVIAEAVLAMVDEPSRLLRHLSLECSEF